MKTYLGKILCLLALLLSAPLPLLHGGETVVATHGQSVADTDLNSVFVDPVAAAGLNTILRHANGHPTTFLGTDPTPRWDLGSKVATTHVFKDWVSVRPILDGTASAFGQTIRIDGSGYARTLRTTYYELKPCRNGMGYSGVLMVTRDLGTGRVIMLRSMIKQSAKNGDPLHVHEFSIAPDGRLYRRSQSKAELVFKSTLGAAAGSSQTEAKRMDARVVPALRSAASLHAGMKAQFADSNLHRSMNGGAVAGTLKVEQQWGQYRQSTGEAETMVSSVMAKLKAWFEKARQFAASLKELVDLVKSVIDILKGIAAVFGF